jgi:hypothetical protein
VKIHLHLNGVRHALTAGNERFAETPMACPKCAHQPLRVHGKGKRPSDDDRAWEADGSCFDCAEPLGLIRADVDTMFGVREDVAVQLRARVYA